jgi:hypothetical protein
MSTGNIKQNNEGNDLQCCENFEIVLQMKSTALLDPEAGSSIFLRSNGFFKTILFAITQPLTEMSTGNIKQNNEGNDLHCCENFQTVLEMKSTAVGPRGWKQYIPPKRQYTSSAIQGRPLPTLPAVRTSYPTNIELPQPRSALP